MTAPLPEILPEVPPAVIPDATPDVLPDFLAPGLTVLFCGTAPGFVSARRGHYYAGPGNRFWGLLAEAGLTPRQLTPDEDHLMPGFGLGLTDLAKAVAGMDKDIPESAYLPQRLAEVVSQWRPGALAFTSLKAARTALGDKRLAPGRLAEDARWPGMALWALPSPSRANLHFSAAPWLDLGRWQKAQGKR